MPRHLPAAPRGIHRGAPSPGNSRTSGLSRRSVLAAGLLAPAAALLTSCGDSGRVPANTLRVMDSYSNDPDYGIIGGALEDAADRVGVKLQRVAVSGQSLIQRVLQQGSSGTLPDILMLDNPDLQQIAATTALRSFDELGIPTEGYHDGVLQAGTYEGDVYGVVPTVNTIALFCNTAMFQEVGLDYPRTWDELRGCAAELTADGRFGIAFCGNATYEGTWQFLPFFWSNGADERSIATEEAAEALGLVSGFVQDGSASSSVLNWGQADVKDQFVAERAAMMVNGPWQLPELSGIEDLEYEIVMLPVRDSAQAPVAPLGGEAWTVPATGDSAKEELAAAVLTEFLSDESILSMAEQRFTVPGRPALTEAYLQRRPDMDTFVDLIPEARARTAQLGENWPTTATALYTALQLALSGQADPAEALDQAEEYV
ncbi:sugar ABC transporter substrate-binding protein [Nesterenkonia xinjiangensis]|uniref:Multiple sugar transport system substrate-binding protein n=1 Tax=Nesterenkonia xinjiangensis TaxID=225327 RepID=A0A7Z0KC22_9MICC|nr:sugar ABC transporter substrate-binding protein [Nesterenkonia xinjiangensis]NYJ78202.1 multiple sugar transport system substrate-binding protein [Nesterenkonia xinjiangensis]